MGWIGVRLPPINAMNITKGNVRKSERGGRKRASGRNCVRGHGRWMNVGIVVEAREVTGRIILEDMMKVMVTVTMTRVIDMMISIIQIVEATMMKNKLQMAMGTIVTMEAVAAGTAGIVEVKMTETADIVAVTMIETADIVAIKMITPMRKMNILTRKITTTKLQVTTVITAGRHIPRHAAAGRVGGQVEIVARTMDPYDFLIFPFLIQCLQVNG
jgi:hypothetical protein